MIPMWPPASEFDILQITGPVLGALSSRRLAGAVEHNEVALEPQSMSCSWHQPIRVPEKPISRTRSGSQETAVSSSAF